MSNSGKRLKVIPLGGLGEIGKNITVFEWGEEIIVVDCGIAFPDDDMFGVDLVLPDTTYLEKNKEKVKGIIVTHGHEDHIGALPYVLKEINVPVFGTKLTLGLLENKLVEHGILRNCQLRTVIQGETIDLGSFKVEFIRSTHSIADAVALAIHTPAGVIVHTSDFKIDYTPVADEVIDLQRLSELGKNGVLLLLCDSTNAERPGYTLSERIVGKAFEEIFADAKGRILVATFASNIHRVQQAVNAAVTLGRKVSFCGRSMVNVSKKAIELGYLNVPNDCLVEIEKINTVRPEEIVIITTGSQGEPMSALARISIGEHRQVKILPDDLVVISATPIPGNRKTVNGVINELFRLGANVIYESWEDIHVSGHACQEELKIIHGLVKPKYFVPVHGEYRHLKLHADLAQSLGMHQDNIFILELGDVLEVNGDYSKVTGKVSSGRVLVDGLGVGDVGNIVLRDRKHLSEDGIIVIIITVEKGSSTLITGLDVITRGFVYARQSEELIRDIKRISKSVVAKGEGKNWSARKTLLKEMLRNHLFKKIKRTPMIIPIVIEV